MILSCGFDTAPVQESCPAQAIDTNGLRNLKKGSEFGACLKEKFGRGGCGRCFVGVPCEHRNPSRR
ncbi:MAG: hypothetical protein IKF00_04175 [Solobacterium sp.]|nr:hypothetical protein [Solobacterium sp.]